MIAWSDIKKNDCSFNLIYINYLICLKLVTPPYIKHMYREILLMLHNTDQNLSKKELFMFHKNVAWFF